ncbi:hypothetical protein [Nocardioides sp.]|uniref:hypothetical protein n=1 Tax=Nocardioides sp. TaxID=35761 RepID=UPI0031FEB244|nr:hypothetical protein [Nocardioides sp.]
MQVFAVLQNVFAGAIVAVCVALLVHQFIGARRRQRLDARVLRSTLAVRAWVQRVARWPSARETARREAEAAIRRAREKAGEWDGNVYRPKSFRKPRKLH